MPFVVTLCVLGAGSYAQEPPLSVVANPKFIAEKRAAYSEAVKSLESYRIEQWKEYQEAHSSLREEILLQVRSRLMEDLCNEIFPAWYGTSFARGGETVVPGEGAISAWRFVATSLEHAGFKVDRDRMSRQAAEKVIVAMTGGKRMVLSGAMKDVMAGLREAGDGVYIVGLDRHIGFVTVKGLDVRFVHASDMKMGSMVICEPAMGENPLTTSRYRVFGKLLDDQMLLAWMKGESFTVK